MSRPAYIQAILVALALNAFANADDTASDVAAGANWTSDWFAWNAPWFFACSLNPEWNIFRERVKEFRRLMSLHYQNPTDEVDEEVSAFLTTFLAEANRIGQQGEETFLAQVNSYDLYDLCILEDSSQLQEKWKDFCFYGFAVSQWVGVVAHQHFPDVPGMSEWAMNARHMLNDFVKYNAMHFLESSGWAVKVEEIAMAVSHSHGEFENHGGQSSAPRAAESVAEERMHFVRAASFRSLTAASGSRARIPETPRLLRAIAVSYHAALLREPLSLWQRTLRDRVHVNAEVHVLDTAARTVGDVRKVSNCRFLAEGAWCTSDARLLQLNDLIQDSVLGCHAGKNTMKHPWITDAAAYRDRFIQLLGADPNWRAADFFVCGEPVYFCYLLSHFGRPVFGYISNPLSIYIDKHDRPQWFSDFHTMVLSPQHVLVATTAIFAENIKYLAGVEIPVVTPACLYTEVSYWPIRMREVLLLRQPAVFWDTECVLNHFALQAFEQRPTETDGSRLARLESAVAKPLSFKESALLGESAKNGYTTFAEFLAAVIFPYSVSQMWFYELYAMGVPIFLPSSNTLAIYIYQCYSTCADFDGSRPGHNPNAVHPYSPFDRTTWEAMLYWAEFTDYLRLPYVEQFQSVPQLLVKLETADLRAQSHAMRQYHFERVGSAISFWGDVLDTVVVDAAEGVNKDSSGTQVPAGSGRDISTNQPCGGTPAREDSPPERANDGDTSQSHPQQFHAVLSAGKASGGKGSHWWVQLQGSAKDPQILLWARDCCSEVFGHRLWLRIGNSTELGDAADCATLDVSDGAQLSTICHGVGSVLFVEARPTGGWGYREDGRAVLMLPEVRVLTRE